MRRIFFVLILLVCSVAHAQTLKIAAAANLRYVLEEIKTSYLLAHPGASVVVNFSSSGALIQQIINGADYDLFMSADNTFPVKLKEQGAASGEIKTYALGKLVLWSNTLDLSKGLAVLATPTVKRIAIAKPELATYGDRAIQCLKSAGLYDKVKDKIVYADNISQTAQFAQTGNADVAFLALSLTLTPEMKGSVYTVDPKSYQTVEQTMVLVKKWKANPSAPLFMKFVLGDVCKSLFEKYGYVVP